MGEIKQRIRLAPDERLSNQREQLAQLLTQIKIQEKKVAAAKAKAHAERVSKLGELVLKLCGNVQEDKLKEVLISANLTN
jgi:hypothetical protein